MSTGKSIEELIVDIDINGAGPGDLGRIIATLRLSMEQTDTWRDLADGEEVRYLRAKVEIYERAMDYYSKADVSVLLRSVALSALADIAKLRPPSHESAAVSKENDEHELALMLEGDT